MNMCCRPRSGGCCSATTPDKRDGFGKWFDVPIRNEVYDYGYDGDDAVCWNSRWSGWVWTGSMCCSRMIWTWRTTRVREVLEDKLSELMAGGYRALMQMRDQGVIKAFGAGVNEWQSCQWLAERGDFDLFLLAGRYTLLEQEALDSFLPLCEARGIGIVIGGPYNSGILATGPREGAFYNYDPAPPEILARVGRIEAVCKAHGVRMVDAAFQFPLHHPAVVSVIPGGQGVAEMKGNLAAAKAEIPAALWQDLKAQGLMRQDAPTP